MKILKYVFYTAICILYIFVHIFLIYHLPPQNRKLQEIQVYKSGLYYAFKQKGKGIILKGVFAKNEKGYRLIVEKYLMVIATYLTPVLGLKEGLLV